MQQWNFTTKIMSDLSFGEICISLDNRLTDCEIAWLLCEHKGLTRQLILLHYMAVLTCHEDYCLQPVIKFG